MSAGGALIWKPWLQLRREGGSLILRRLIKRGGKEGRPCSAIFSRSYSQTTRPDVDVGTPACYYQGFKARHFNFVRCTSCLYSAAAFLICLRSSSTEITQQKQEVPRMQLQSESKTLAIIHAARCLLLCFVRPYKAGWLFGWEG